PVQRLREDGKVEWIVRARTVELGLRTPGWTEVREGLTPGELIVRRGAEALEDGTPIRFASLPQQSALRLERLTNPCEVVGCWSAGLSRCGSSASAGSSRHSNNYAGTRLRKPL